MRGLPIGLAGVNLLPLIAKCRTTSSRSQREDVHVGKKKHKTNNKLKALFAQQCIEIDGEKVLVCPICLRIFEEQDLEVRDGIRLLTIEHAPQQMQGTAAVERCITCHTCNNECGFEAKAGNLRSIRTAGSIDLLQRPIPRRLTSTDSGLLIQQFRYPHVHGKELKSGLYATKPSPRTVGAVQPIETLVELKTAYLIAFAALGYSYILTPALNVVRQAILRDQPLHCCAVIDAKGDFFDDELLAIDAYGELCLIVKIPPAHPTPRDTKDGHIVLLPRPGSSSNIYKKLGLASDLTPARQNLSIESAEHGGYAIPGLREVPRHWDHPCNEDHPKSTSRFGVVDFDCEKHGPERVLVIDPVLYSDEEE